MKLTPPPLAFCIALVCATTTPVLADSGVVAYSRPIKNVVVDGRPDDWPNDVQSFPINRTWQEDLQVAPTDFSATFKSGFSSRKRELYFLVEVRDESLVDDRLDGDLEAAWQANDALILYLDTQHSPKGSGPQVFLNFANQRKAISKRDAWDPASKRASWDNVELAVKRERNVTTYEWKFKNCDNIQVGNTVGLDFLICDADREDEAAGSIHLWGPGVGKSRGGGKLGELVLLSADSELFDVSGKLEWKHLPTPVDAEKREAKKRQPFPDRVHLFSGTKLASTVDVNQFGEFKTKLREGDYRVSLANVIAEDVRDEKDRRIRIADGPVIVAGQKNKASVAKVTLEFEARPHFSAKTSPLFEYSQGHDAGLTEVLDRYREYFNVPGYSIALVHNGKLVFAHAAGQSNRFTGKPVDESTQFEAASITKPVFAFAVNRLAEKGEIDLDQPLCETLEFAEMAIDPRVRKITARHCLNHSSGLPNWFNEGEKMLFAPGEKHGYSGAGMEYLGRVVAHTQKRPLEQIVMDEACRPLGFTESVFFSDSVALRAVASFGHVNGMPQAHDNATDIGVASSMFTESKAFAKFMIGLMNRKGLSPQTYAEMFDLSMPNESEGQEKHPNGFGLGFQIEESEHGKIIKHGGNNGDFQCLFEIYDKTNDGFVMFTNADTGGALIAAVRDYLIDGEIGDPKASKPKGLSVEALDAKLLEFERQAVLPGFAVSIFDKDKIIYEKGFGFADIKNKRSFTPDSVQMIASISKTVVSTAMMQAIEKGKLSLDDPINDHLPFKVVHPKFPDVPITIRHLATHTSSIDDGSQFDRTYLFRGKLNEADFPKAHHKSLRIFNQNKRLELQEYLEKALSVQGEWNNGTSFLKHKPGASYEYSNSGIGLLGLVIQTATGTEFRELTQGEIIKPIGMQNTTWRLNKVDPKRHVVYYNELLNPVPRYTFSTYPDGGVFSSVSDMRKFMQEMMRARLGGSKLLTRKSAVEMMAESGLPIELPVALVWDTEMGDGKLIGHAGNDFGTSTYMYSDPTTGIGRILFSNVSIELKPLESMFNEIYNLMFMVDPKK